MSDNNFDINDQHHSTAMPTAGATASTLPLPPAGWYPDPLDAAIERYWNGSAWGGATRPTGLDSEPGSAPTEGSASTHRRLRWWQWALIITGAIVLATLVVGAINAGSSSSDAGGGTSPSAAPVEQRAQEVSEEVETVDVPDLVGSTISEARAALAVVGLELAASEAGDDWIITAQQPSAGTHPVEGLSLSVTSEAPEPVYTLEQQNALDSAQSYLGFMAFSRQGLIDQLSSEYGAGFPIEVATWAADTVGADWNAEAAEAAKSYLEFMSFSRQGLYDQLTSAYGGQFTPEQANHGLAAVGY